VETSIWAALGVSNCSTLTVTEVGCDCGLLLIGDILHLTAWHQHRRDESASDGILDMLLDP